MRIYSPDTRALTAYYFQTWNGLTELMKINLRIAPTCQNGAWQYVGMEKIFFHTYY